VARAAPRVGDTMNRRNFLTRATAGIVLAGAPALIIHGKPFQGAVGVQKLRLAMPFSHEVSCVADMPALDSVERGDVCWVMSDASLYMRNDNNQWTKLHS